MQVAISYTISDSFGDLGHKSASYEPHYHAIARMLVDRSSQLHMYLCELACVSQCANSLYSYTLRSAISVAFQSWYMGVFLNTQHSCTI
jgi:hypothetical protein